MAEPTPSSRVLRALVRVALPAVGFGLVLGAVALVAGGASALITVALGWGTVVLFYVFGQAIELRALEMASGRGMGLVLGSYAVRVTGIALGLWGLLSLPAVRPHVSGTWLLFSVAGTVIVWVTSVVVHEARRRVPVYDTPYEPPADDETVTS